jgi:hypothetical protein
MLPNRTPRDPRRYARLVTVIRASVASGLRRRSARNADFGALLETFLVAAVVTILVIRTQL